MWTVADFETCALEKSSSSDSGRWLFISTLNFLQSSGAVAVTQKGEILSECQHYVTSPYSKYSFRIEHLLKWKFSLFITSEWAWQTVLFVCLFFQVDAVTILLSNILPVPCSHNSVKTKAVVEIFLLFFDWCCWQRCKWEHSVLWKQLLGEFYANDMFIAEESAGSTRHFVHWGDFCVNVFSYWGAKMNAFLPKDYIF